MIITLTVFSLISGLLAIENLIWGQFMLSRPIIFIPLAVLILTIFFDLPPEFRYFLLTGAVVLELFYLFSLPIGSSYVPNQVLSGNFLIVALLFLKKQGFEINGNNWATSLVLLLLLAILVSFVSAYFDILLRQFNSYLVEYSKRYILSGEFKTFESVAKWGFILFFSLNFIQLYFYFFLMMLFSKQILSFIEPGSELNLIFVIFIVGFVAKIALNIFRKLRRNDLPIYPALLLIILTLLSGISPLWNLLTVLLFIVFLIKEGKGVRNG
ncbi:PTS sugar transporter subunit IIC [bacterium]|nr:PTS sugar transporter subunit IIC [bacterium]